MITFSPNTKAKSSEVNQNFTDLSTGAADTPDNSLQLYRTESATPFVANGGVWSTVSGLAGAMTACTYYAPSTGGLLVRITVSAIASHTFTASKDTYIDAKYDGTLTYVEVANNAASPALTANSLRLAKVITSGSAITSIVQSQSSDSLGNIMRNTGAVSAKAINNPYKFRVYRASAANTGAGAYSLITFDTKTYDTGSNYSTATGQFTAPVAGFYQFNWEVSATMTGLQTLFTALHKNATETSRGIRIVGNSVTLSSHGSDIIQMAASDTADIRAFGDTARPLDFGSPTVYFSGFLVSAN